ncbi:phage portal protein family protein [Parasphaerochaeta coccoides]|uniref:Mu-like prophage protein gp29 n=1 Tax=Parasphaerochaeta coccoides (strain ATCC BAA-1237 / DSM 17374 / SPN1) TaxID=760011 RepID=F4GHE2_PARC1|nr:DUF935 family protein [Parasphaerochaeta coccoides]AEC02041.1 protein of unknown function DUF935 [Parasphaerochaeta coccoides DSM 17374]
MAKTQAHKKDPQLLLKVIKDSLVMQYLPNPDEAIRRNPKGLKLYDEMLQDPRISSLFLDRRNATQNLPLSLSKAEDVAVKDYADRYLSEKSLRKWSSYLLTDSLKYGFRPAEIVWQKDEDGFYYIDALIGHDINRYRFGDDGQMYYDQGNTLLEQPYKWIIHRIEGDRYNAPYGQAYMKSVYWVWAFKKLGWQYWLTATEKFSVPSVYAIFDQSDPGKAREVAADLAETVSQMVGGSSGAFANVKAIQQISMTGSVADFDILIKACDLQISYGMTGQALANNVSDTGTQALGTVQERTKAAAYENDARALAYTVQRLIAMSIELNFGPDADAPEFRYDTGDYASFADVVTAINTGIPVSKAALYARYNLPEPEDDEDVFTRPEGIGMSMTPSLGAFDFADMGTGKKKVLRPMMILTRSLNPKR